MAAEEEDPMFKQLVRVSLISVLVLGAGCKKKPPEHHNKPQHHDNGGSHDNNDFKSGPVIDPVNFNTGSTDVENSEKEECDRAADVMKNGNWKVLLVGLADSSGDAASNKVLSERRAQAVSSELQRRGVAANRISIQSMGERLATGEALRERKVEFVFYTGGANLSFTEIAERSHVMDADFHGRN